MPRLACPEFIVPIFLEFQSTSTRRRGRQTWSEAPVQTYDSSSHELPIPLDLGGFGQEKALPMDFERVNCRTVILLCTIAAWRRRKGSIPPNSCVCSKLHHRQARSGNEQRAGRIMVPQHSPLQVNVHQTLNSSCSRATNQFGRKRFANERDSHLELAQKRERAAARPFKP